MIDRLSFTVLILVLIFVTAEGCIDRRYIAAVAAR